MTWRPDALQRRLSQYVEDGALCLGVVASVSHRGVQHDLAFGLAGPEQPATAATIWRLYCTAKPVVALAVGLAAHRGQVAWDRPVREHPVRPELRHLACTPRQLLDHTAGLHGLHGLGFGALPADRRAAAVRDLSPPPGWDPGRRAAYSEYAAWHVLGWLLEDVTGRTLADVLRRDVLEPFAGGELWFGMTDDEHRVRYHRIAVPSDLRGGAPVPLLAHRNRRPCTETNPAYGGYGTARALQRCYRTILDLCAGRHRRRIPRTAVEPLIRASRPPRHDEVLGRRCTFGLGFMVDLVDHGFDRCVSDRAFGHSGFHGTSFAMADPAHDLAVAVAWNGVVDGDLGVHVRRNAVLRALYQDIGAIPERGDRRARGARTSPDGRPGDQPIASNGPVPRGRGARGAPGHLDRTA